MSNGGSAQRPASWLLKPAALRIAAGGVLTVVAIVVVLAFLPGRRLGSDFSLAYLPGRLLIEGYDVYAESLDTYNATHGLPFVGKIGPATNPPLLVWLFSWLARLDPTTAYWVWTLIQMASLLVVLGASHRLVGQRLSPSGWVLATGLTLCSMPMLRHFWFAQVQLPIAGLLLIGLVACRQNRRWIAIVVLTLAVVLKLYPWPFALLPVLGLAGRERSQRLLLVAGLLALWAIIPGWGLWVSFYRHAVPHLRALTSGDYYNFTITSLINGLLGQVVGGWLGGLLSLLVVALAWWRCDRALQAGSVAIEPAACLLLVSTVMCSAIAWTHYLTLLIYPLICLAAEAKEASGISKRCALGMLIACLITFNLAGSNPLAGLARPLTLLGAQAPLLAMLALYLYFYRRLGSHERIEPPHHHGSSTQ